MRRWLNKKIVEPELTLYVWELLIIASVEVLLLVGWWYVLER
jgi:hypothetical protein